MIFMVFRSQTEMNQVIDLAQDHKYAYYPGAPLPKGIHFQCMRAIAFDSELEARKINDMITARKPPIIPVSVYDDLGEGITFD